MNTFQEFIKTKAHIKELQGKLQQLEIELYNKYSDELNQMETGTFNRNEGDFKVKIVKKETTSVDQNMAKTLHSLHPDAFKVKYDLNKTAVKSMDPSTRSQIEECLTTKPAKPSFSVEMNNGN